MRPDSGRAGGPAAAVDALGRAVTSLYDQALDRVLMSPSPVTSAAEGRRLLAADEQAEGLADQVQRVVVLAVPVLRIAARGARWTHLPWALVASTTISVAIAVRTGVREVQALASLLAHRIELETGQPADRALVKRLAIELYLRPKRPPDLSAPRPAAGRLVRRWIFRGALGRDTASAASKALDAAERLDVKGVVARWARGPGSPDPVGMPAIDPPRPAGPGRN